MCMSITLHVVHNKHCIRDGDAFVYEDTLHLLTLTQTFHFTFTYIKRSGYVLFLHVLMNGPL